MGQSSRSSSTLKKTFQTFKSFTPIQRTTRTGRMKCLLPIVIISLAALCSASAELEVEAPPEVVEAAVDEDVEAAIEEVAEVRSASPWVLLGCWKDTSKRA